MEFLAVCAVCQGRADFRVCKLCVILCQVDLKMRVVCVSPVLLMLPGHLSGDLDLPPESVVSDRPKDRVIAHDDLGIVKRRLHSRLAL